MRYPIIGGLLLCIILAGCGGGGSSSTDAISTDCLALERNCSDADVDIVSAIRYAADNGIDVVHVRWAGCCNDDRYFAISEYAYSLGVAVIWPAGDSSRELKAESPAMLVVSGYGGNANYGDAVDVILDSHRGRGSIHGGIHALALAIKLYDTYPKQEALRRLMSGDYQGFDFIPDCDRKECNYPAKLWKTNRTVLIVDNGFDNVRPLYTVHKNTLLAGKITGDYGVKAINELSLWVDGVQVIGYVPFNTMPVPRIDGWDIK